MCESLNKHKLFFHLLFFIVSMLSTYKASAGDFDRPVATVLNGDLNDMRLYSGQHEQDLMLNTKLYIGHVIVPIGDEKVSIRLKYCGEKKLIEIDPKEELVIERCENIKVDNTNDVNSNIAGILNRIALNIRDLIREDAGYGSANIKGEKVENSVIRSDLLSENITFLSPGEKKLWINWVGGEKPFEVSIASKELKLGVIGERVNSEEWESPNIDFRKGFYEIKIVDKNNKSLIRQVKVSDAPIFPSWPRYNGALSEYDKELVLSMWLYDLNSDGRWSLEAYNRLRNRSDTAAHLIMDAIMNQIDLNTSW